MGRVFAPGARVANVGDPPRPWKNVFAEDGGADLRGQNGGRVCELIQALKPGSPAAAARHPGWQ
jgi:hypothetical protein